MSQKIDELANRIEPAPEIVCIEIPATWGSELQEELLRRHYELHPNDRRADHLIWIRRFCGDDPDGPGRPALWRVMSREMVLPITSESEWQRLLDEWQGGPFDAHGRSAVPTMDRGAPEWSQHVERWSTGE